MSNYPNGYDDDSTLPPVNDNLTELGADAINALRDAIIQIEMALGTNIAGVAPTLADRLGVFINPDGTPNTSIIYALGLVTLPISNSMIAPAAGIQESKLMLDYPTQDLFNYIRDLAKDVNLALGWISVSGVKLEPHLIGAIYRHDLAMIDVAQITSQFLNNVFRLLRDNTNAYTLLNDMNNELLAHQWADGSPFGTPKNITTNDGSTYPSNYAHVASGVFLDTSGFAVIPQTAISDQLAWDFIDQNSIFTLGTRIQNLYANGISVNSQSSSLTTDGYGQPLIPPTPAIAYLRGSGSGSQPVDSITNGDDIIQFMPPSDGYYFDEQFALVRVGDIVRVNYANDGYFVEVAHVISEKKYIPGVNGSSSSFFVRIAGTNFAYAPNAVARVDKTLFNNDKQGVLAISGVNSTNLGSTVMPSLIVGSPRGAQCIGVGFNPNEFNETHYILYLALYPNGNPLDGYTILPGIDVTGNAGTTPGNYTLDDIVNATNLAFRQPGFNYRFVAFQRDGEFGIMLADSYNNVSFSVLNGIVTSGGFYSQFLSELNFPNNVIDLFPSAQTVTTGATVTLPVTSLTVASTAGFNTAGTLSVTTTANGIQAITYTGITGNTFTGVSGGTGSLPTGAQVVEQLLGITAPDPLGFGPYGAGVSGPPFMTAYGSSAAASIPTIVFPPLRRNNYYVNGAEEEKLANYVSDGQVQDSYGDGYWIASIEAVNPGAGNVSVTYLIPLDLSTSDLKAGKTIVVQPLDRYGLALVDFGRFVISEVDFICPSSQTYIKVYDAVHAVGGSPYPVAPVGSPVAIYFSNDSVSFNNESATDFVSVSAPFKRHFEVYVDGNGNTFTHERARFNPSGSSGSSIIINTPNGTVLYGDSAFSNMDIVGISPTLRGYQFGNVNKINLNITSFNGTTGKFTGYLNSFDGTDFLSQGAVITGQMGDVVRFYDQSHVDYIDVIFQFASPSPNFSNQYIDIQLFPSLSLDQNNMLLGTVEVSGGNTVSQFQDLRQFGNTSEQQFTTSALDYISFPEKILHFNGVVRGLGFLNNDGGPRPPTQYESAAFMSLNGGLALTNGNFCYVNPQIFLIPALQEVYLAVNYPINYALCVNAESELVTIVLTDYDPIAGTPNQPARVVTVLNTVSSTTYQVDSTTFSDLLNTRADLTPLYIVSTAVTGASISTSTTITKIRDVRRYITNSDATGPAVLSVSDLNNGITAQGNFVKLSTALNWLTFNSTYQNTLQVKGSFTETNDPGFNIPLIVEASGANSSLTVNGTVNMSEATFNGMNLTFSTILNATNVTFNSCSITVGSGSTLNNVTFNDCALVFSGTNTWTDVIIDPSTVTLNGATTINNVSISNTTFTINVINAFALGSGNSFQGCTFNSLISPVGIGTYSSADLVNAQNGLMYASVGSTPLNGLIVENCTFTNRYSDHHPFISLQLNSLSSYVSNVNISGNQFTSLATNDDIRAVVAINTTVIATGTSGSSNYPAFPKLVNVSISNNVCNFDQMIIMSTARTSGAPITGAMLTCVGCKINGNVCGTIAYMTAADFISNGNNSETANLGFIRDKVDQLLIQNNTTKLITNLDSTGQFISFYSSDAGSPANWVEVGTGACVIEGNTSNWILVGVASWAAAGANYTNDNEVGIDILKNRLSPANPGFLTPYQDVNFSVLVPPNIGIHLRQATHTSSDFNYTLSQIAYNTMDTRSWLESVGATYNYHNYSTCIKVENSANVFGNSVNRSINSYAAPIIYLGGGSAGGPNIRVTDNMLTRDTNNIAAYVQGANSNATNNVTIINNTFDSPFIDSGNSNENVGLNISPNWVFQQNRNQTAYTSIPLRQLQDLTTDAAGHTTTALDYFGFSDSSIKDWRWAQTNNPLSVNLHGSLASLPVGVNLLFVVMGFNLEYSPGSIDTTLTNNISFQLFIDKPSNFSTSNPAQSIGSSFIGSNADNVSSGYQTGTGSIANSNTLTIASSSDATNFNTKTQFMWKDLSTYGWSTKNNQIINIVISGTFNATTTYTDSAVMLSPILIKYRW